MRTTVECVWKLGAELAEGPLWSEAAQTLWFVDIRGKRIHSFEPATGATQSFDAPQMPGFIAADGENFIVGLQDGLYMFEPGTGAFSLLWPVEAGKPGNRINDGARDVTGRLWFGTLEDAEVNAAGTLYRLDLDGPKAMDTGILVSNGPCSSPDGKTFYHSDSPRRTIYAYDLAEDGGLSNKRVFATVESGEGYPDGSVTDADGCLWVGMWGGWGARRYAPDGKLMSATRFPCANVTKLALVGKTAYATTAWKGLDAAARAEQPLAGGLFRFETD
jgi:sugar lactone lactonase YvrE